MVGPAGRDGMRVARPGPTVAEAARCGPAPYAGAVAYAWRMNELTVPSYVLNDGSDLPAVGFGTYGLRGSGGVDAMVSAVRTGYRLLDSAFNYENEGILGEAARRCGVPREELRLVSKLPGRCQHYDRAVATVEESLLRAGLDYWDMYLIHWPNPGRGLYVEAFGALVDLRGRGLIRSVGVCNFLPEHIDRLRDEVGALPSVNQIELHPYFPQADALAYHASVGVRTQSWSPLARKLKAVEDPAIIALADEAGVSPAQVAELQGLVDSGRINDKLARQALEGVLAGEGSPAQVVEARGLEVVSDDGALTAAVQEALDANPDVVEKIKGGKVKAAGALVGAVMKATRGQADAARVRELIMEMVGA